MLRAEKMSGNPGSVHREGVAAMQSLISSRERIAAELGCKSREIIFTSGLTEANNLAILGFAQALDRAGKELVGTHWIVSAIEHQSVLACFAELERLGARVTHLDPDPKGRISAEAVTRALRKETIYISIGWANSEIGFVQSLSEIAHAIRAHEKKHDTTVIFHSDAGQGPLYRAPKVATLGVDLFSLGSGKLYGPRGIGTLFVGKRAVLAALTLGGAQERGVRAGTEPVALAAGFAEAMVRAGGERAAEAKRLQKLRDDFVSGISAHVQGAIINGDLKRALPHMLNISIPRIQSEYFVLALDRAGIALSTKAACSEGDARESHVVAALEIRPPRRENAWRAQNTLRFSFGKQTTASDMRWALKTFLNVLKHLHRS